MTESGLGSVGCFVLQSARKNQMSGLDLVLEAPFTLAELGASGEIHGFVAKGGHGDSTFDERGADHLEAAGVSGWFSKSDLGHQWQQKNDDPIHGTAFNPARVT